MDAGSAASTTRPRRQEQRALSEASDAALEILPVSLLSEHRESVSHLRELARELRIGLGWHYLLDLAWIAKHLGTVRGKTILDAGAGWGLIQWYLCEAGARVMSVDRASRAAIAVRFRARYAVHALRDEDLEPLASAIGRELVADALLPRSIARQLRNLAEAGRRRILGNPGGQVVIYNQDLRDLDDIRSSSVDAVVAVSALEHNPPEELRIVVAELLRVLRPGGRLIATLGASADGDWFHEPSQGWCYSEDSLRRMFGIAPSVPSNYDHYERLLSELRACSELRDNLASFYFQSDRNGMPWGVWNPRYQPVGVMVTKSERAE